MVIKLMNMEARQTGATKQTDDAKHRQSAVRQAIILAGGRGERLRPLTDSMPKPLLPVAGRPVLEWQLMLLKKHGIEEVIICGHYLFEKIKGYFGDSWNSVNIKYLDEPVPLGTGGAIKNAENLIDGTFLVVYGDTMLDMNIRKLVEFHQQHGCIATITVHKTDHPEDSDLVEMHGSRVTKIIKKPHGIKGHGAISKTSVFVLEPEILKYVPERSDLEKDVLQPLVKKGQVAGYMTDEFIKDMGTHERYKKVQGVFRGISKC